MNADLINGQFELLSGLLCCLNIAQLRRDKRVQGVNVWVQVFFSSWGLWNLYYYPSLHQWASFAGGLFIVAANGAWCILALYYRRKGKRV